ncbi:conserved hypothetical protein [Trichinella spiralis]|uniref:hypothetical protein n=1 Tax=Trichinella spiralis TaxID=6334 RepID=UPI0001EFEC96|nr:conserved hypothetical protein [Trichinella spiralis]
MASSYVPLQEVRRSWFEYRIEIKKESYEHILQEQPVSHRRMAIFDCMPVELTVATELKSNKEGYFWPSPYSSQLFMKITICLCVNYTTKEVTVRKKCPRKKTIIFHSKFEMESFCMIFGCVCENVLQRNAYNIYPCRRIAVRVVISRLEFTITGCLLHFGMKLWHCMILVRIHNARKEVVVQQRSSMGTASSQMKMDTFGYAFHSREKWSVSTCRSTALSCRCGRVSCWI